MIAMLRMLTVGGLIAGATLSEAVDLPTCRLQPCRYVVTRETVLADRSAYEPVGSLTIRANGGTVLVSVSVEATTVGTPYDPWHGTLDVRLRNTLTNETVNHHEWYSNFDQARGVTIQQHRAVTVELLLIERPGRGQQTYIIEARGGPNPATQSAGWTVSAASITVHED